MKIVVTTTAPNIEADVDPRFGRSACLIVVDTDTMHWAAHPNPGAGASGGAGTLAAQFVADQGAEAAISGDFGPNAYRALEAAGVSMYVLGQSRTAHDAIERFKLGQLSRFAGSTSRQPHRA
jgi:predicted Fe-Mo cluster-binding NifX family protein